MAKRILVLDDDPIIVDYLVDFFNDNGYSTCYAYNTDEGFDILKKEKTDLITLDLDMPKISGPLFFTKLKEQSELKNIPVVVISGLNAPHRSLKRAVATLEKPSDQKELLIVVKNILG